MIEYCLKNYQLIRFYSLPTNQTHFTFYNALISDEMCTIYSIQKPLLFMIRFKRIEEKLAGLVSKSNLIKKF